MLLLREQKAEPDDPDPDRWWVIQDRPGLSGTDIKDPEQSFDTTIGNEPIVTFNFTDKGRQAFQAITRHVAERGADNAFGGDPLQTSQHFAIALDNELVSAPYINWRQNSEGIDGSTGAQISGSFTIQSAQDLATILKIGALPLKLNEVSRSQVSATLGQQALDQGLKAGIAGFIIVALFLIIFYRVLGVIATLALLHLRAVLLRARQADPDHADAAGHRGSHPDARRRRGREHRRLRTREGGGAGREIGRAPRSSRATARA